MTDELELVSASDLPAVVSSSTTPSPAAVYLARLAPGSRRTMTGCLETLAPGMSGGPPAVEDFPWQALRYEHTQAVRARLAETLAPATANKHLSALRGDQGSVASRAHVGRGLPARRRRRERARVALADRTSRRARRAQGEQSA